jgi:microcystin-dependent protein
VSDQYLGELRLFPYNFAPLGWAFCNGQILPISQNTALFSLLGTTYGGNGTTTFALPDLRGRVPITSGQGPGISPYTLGQVGGFENVPINASNLPAHNHTVSPGANDSAATGTRPGGSVLARVTTAIYAGSTDGTTMAPTTTSNTGSNVPVSVLQPYLVLNFCIALQGVYPARS